MRANDIHPPVNRLPVGAWPAQHVFGREIVLVVEGGEDRTFALGDFTKGVFFLENATGYLIAPCVSPATSFLCSGRKSSNVGTVATTEPAITAPQSTWSSPKY